MGNRSHGAARAWVGLFSLENRALLFLAQVTCKRYSSLTCRYRCCCRLLAWKEASKGLAGAFGRGLDLDCPALPMTLLKMGCWEAGLAQGVAQVEQPIGSVSED